MRGAAVVLAAVTLGLVVTGTRAQMPGMGSGADLTPPVDGFSNAQPVTFIHTEASDAKVAAMLTRMMGPKVLVVPSLAKVLNLARVSDLLAQHPDLLQALDNGHREVAGLIRRYGGTG